MVDLNVDLGEGFGSYRMADDEALLAHVTSANVACGFHAGDPRIMDATVAAAVEAGVAIGAHVSYPDLVGFGRRSMRLSAEELVTDTLYQLGALDAFCRRYGTALTHVKAHGALYNDLAVDATLASALGDAVLAYGGDLSLVVLARSAAVGLLRGKGLTVIEEGFADRAYTAEGQLVARREPGSVIHDSDLVVRRGLQLAGGRIEDRAGNEIRLEVGTICVHGDTPGSVGLAEALRAALEAGGVTVAAPYGRSAPAGRTAPAGRNAPAGALRSAYRARAGRGELEERAGAGDRHPYRPALPPGDRGTTSRSPADANTDPGKSADPH